MKRDTRDGLLLCAFVLAVSVLGACLDEEPAIDPQCTVTDGYVSCPLPVGRAVTITWRSK
jgi:hypothetical protein